MAREKLPQKVLAQRLDVDVRQIRNLEKKPGFPVLWEQDEKRYPWPEVLHWYVAFKSEAASAKFTGPKRFEAAQIRDMDARAAKTELALAQARGELLERHTVRRERQQAWAVLRNQSTTRASRWAPELEGLSGPLLLQKLEELAEQELAALLQALLGIPTYDEALREALDAADEMARERAEAEDADRPADR